jgi:hypothetical protein
MKYKDLEGRNYKITKDGRYRLGSTYYVLTQCNVCGDKCLVENKYYKKNGGGSCDKFCRGVSESRKVDNGSERKCARCKEWKPHKEYYESPTKLGIRCYCKECCKEKEKEYHKRPEVKLRMKEWNKQYRQTPKGREACRKSCKTYQQTPRAKEVRKIWNKKLRGTVKGNIDNRMGPTLRRVLGSKKAGRRWEDILGYTSEELIAHLNTTMPEGYTWDDLSKLHIDHIIPISHFKYSSTEDPDFKKCWDLTNLQLLPAAENLEKKNMLPDEWEHKKSCDTHNKETV